MAILRTQCPLCTTDRSSLLRGHEAHRLRLCPVCGFVFSERVPSPEELARYYSTYPATPPLSPITRRRFQELIEGMEALVQGRTMLDVGCGRSDLLDVAQARGWTTHGTELHPAAVELGRSKGHRMHEGPLRVEDHGDRRYDLIVSVEVLEHLTSPMEEVQRMARLLAPGGVLYITTPNFDALNHTIAGPRWRMFNHPEHLCFFTRRTIDRCFRSNGLRKVRLRTTGFGNDRYRVERPTAPQHDHPPEELRERIEGSAFLRSARSAANLLLDLTGRGDTLKAWYRKPVQ